MNIFDEPPVTYDLFFSLSLSFPLSHLPRNIRTCGYKSYLARHPPFSLSTFFYSLIFLSLSSQSVPPSGGDGRFFSFSVNGMGSGAASNELYSMFFFSFSFFSYHTVVINGMKCSNFLF